MIGKLTLGKSFKFCGEYMLTGRDRVHPDQRVSWMECHNLPTERMEVAVRLMAATSRRSRRTQLPVLQLSVSFAPGDPVDSAMIKRMLQRTLRDVGLGEHQAILLEHHDTAVPHGHAIVNRVHPETGRAWKGSFSKTRIEASLRRQEQDEGLRVVPGWLAPVPGAPELRPRPRLSRADQEFLREVKQRAGPVLERAQSWSAAEAGLAELGLRVRVNGRGMSVTDGHQEVKASEIDRQASRFQLEKRLGRYSDYRLRRAVASEIMGQARTDAPGDAGRVRAAAAPPARRPAADPQQRFSLYEENGTFGVWDSVGPNIFFAETRERAEAEMQRANRLVARYPNIGVVRCLRDMDGEWRDARGLPRVLEEKGRPRRRRALPTRPESISPQVAVDHARAVEPPSHATPSLAQAPAKQQDAPPAQRASFLSEVRRRATSVLRMADSWADLEHGLDELGLSLRVKGGGFVVTDGQREAKASEVGREFSRARMEARLGPLSSHQRMAHAAAVEVRRSEVQPGRAHRESEMRDAVTSTPAPAPEPQAVEQRQTPTVSMQPLEDHNHRQAELRRRVEALRDGLRSAATIKPELQALSHDPAVDAFLYMAERRLQADALNSELRSAGEALAEVEGWVRALDQSNVVVRRATEALAREIRGALRDPQRFTAEFRRLPEERKRSLLRMLREQPNAFAREFLNGFGVAEQRPLHPSGWRAALESMADQLSGRTAAAKVFRAPEGVRGTARLLADAGDYYLDMLEARTRTRGRIAAALGLPQDTLAENLREACRSRVDATERERSNLQLRRDAIDAAPSRRELADRYLRLRPEQRVHVRGASTRLMGLIVDVARLAERMARGPEHERDGPGL